MDEAAAKLKMEITSKPLALDEVGGGWCWWKVLLLAGEIAAAVLPGQDSAGSPAIGLLQSPQPHPIPALKCPAMRHVSLPPSLPALLQVDRKVLQLEMERLSLGKAADTDRGARQRLSGLDSQLEGGRGRAGGRRRGCSGMGAALLQMRNATAPAGFEATKGILILRRCPLCSIDPPPRRPPLTSFTLPCPRPAPPLPAPPPAALKEQQAELSAMWEEEKEEMSKVQQLKGEIDRVNIEIQVGAAPACLPVSGLIGCCCGWVLFEGAVCGCCCSASWLPHFQAHAPRCPPPPPATRLLPPTNTSSPATHRPANLPLPAAGC